MEMYVYYSIIVFTIIIISLYLYIISEKISETIRNSRIKKYEKDLIPIVDATINEIIDTGNSMSIKRRSFKKFLNNKLKKTIIEVRLTYYLENFNGDFTSHLTKFCEENGLIDKELKELSKKNMYIKALACKRLGEMKSLKATPYLLEAANSSSQDVIYNALLALAKIGDQESFIKAFENINSSTLLSERSLIEIVDSFEGNKNSLYSKMIHCDNEFVSCIFIKSAGNFQDYQLGKNISKFLKSDSKERKIAAIKALGSMSDTRFINEITALLKDESWEIRAIAAKVLGRYGDISITEKLIDALSDRQWFVRFNAASSILALDKELKYVSKVFQGEDKFAKDILISAMESDNKLNIILDYTSSLNESLKHTAILIRKYILNGGDYKHE